MKFNYELKTNGMQHLLVVLALFFSSMLMAQTNMLKQDLNQGQSIKVSVINALSNTGSIHFALHNENTFRKSKALFAQEAIINENVSSVVFENIPEGEYAIICYHDENENKRMDFQENGIPIENYGTSNNAMNFGPPQFDSSKFELVNEDLILEIKF